MARSFISACAIPALCACLQPVAAQSIYSKQGLFDESTGYVQSQVAGEWYRGSGVIARDPRLIYSCGHVFYESGVWATDYAFHRAYHSGETPSFSEGASPRGFRYFASYSTNADTYGTSSSETYVYDFTVLYGNSSFGTPVGWWNDGGEALQSDRWKKIVGYPSTVAYTGAPGYSYQHSTDWFSNTGSQIKGPYHHFINVSTGKGNSGGPVFVWDADSETYYLGGILVSGDETLAGVYALNSSSNTMASNALGLEKITRTFANSSALKLPDASRSYTTRKVVASGFSDTISALKFSVSITTPRRGDLDVYLRSPTGRIRWITKKSTSTADHLVRNKTDYSSTFRGYAANGQWQLKMRDSVRRNRATFKRFSVTVTALGE